MKFCFVDESGDAGQSEWFWLGGFVVDVSVVAEFPEVILAPFNSPEQAFIREETLKVLREDNTMYSREERREMSDRLYNHLDEQTDYSVFSVGMHQDKLDMDNGDEIYRFAFTMLIERFDWFLEKDCEGEYGCLFIDTTSRMPEIQDEHNKIRTSGSGHKTIEQVVSIGAPIRDEYSPGVQLADLVTSGVRAYFVDGFRYYYETHLKPHIHRHPSTDNVRGVGVKIHPKSSYDELEIDPE